MKDKCWICGRFFGRDNSFTWLNNGQPANVRFCSAECLLVYYGPRTNKKEAAKEETKE
jgi:hypothetical protein